MNILLVKKYYQRWIIEQSKFAYSHLEKAFKKQSEKQVGASKPLQLSSKNDELNQIDSIFPQSLMIDLIRFKLKEMIKL